MLKWRLPRISGIRDGDHIPMGPEMLPKDRVVGFADLAALEVEVGYCRQRDEGNGLRLQ